VARGKIVPPSPFEIPAPGGSTTPPPDGGGPTEEPRPLPDLTGSAVSADRINVSNIGSADAGAFTVRVASSSDTAVETFEIPGLAAGASRDIDLGCAGTRTAVVDYGNRVSETNESNNSFSVDCKP
jgi:hypothetical protein